jgi:hypothetical protein
MEFSYNFYEVSVIHTHVAAMWSDQSPCALARRRKRMVWKKRHCCEGTGTPQQRQTICFHVTAASLLFHSNALAVHEVSLSQRPTKSRNLLQLGKHMQS